MDLQNLTQICNTIYHIRPRGLLFLISRRPHAVHNSVRYMMSRRKIFSNKVVVPISLASEVINQITQIRTRNLTRYGLPN